MVSVVIKHQAGVVFDTSVCGRLQCLVVSTLVSVSLRVAEGTLCAGTCGWFVSWEGGGVVWG